MLKRFYKRSLKKSGLVEIITPTSTEPICLIYEKWHPGIADIILEYLNETHKNIPMDKLSVPS